MVIIAATFLIQAGGFFIAPDIPFIFFVSLFFSVSSVLSLVGYILRVALYQDELFLNHFNISLRQGIIIGLCISALMGLQVMRTLTWWNGVIIVVICFLVEIYFVARE